MLSVRLAIQAGMFAVARFVESDLAANSQLTQNTRRTVAFLTDTTLPLLLLPQPLPVQLQL